MKRLKHNSSLKLNRIRNLGQLKSHTKKMNKHKSKIRIYQNWKIDITKTPISK